MNNYWNQSKPLITNQSPVIPEKTDILIIGGGITGLNAARELLLYGKQVVILESGNIGHGASGKNAGFVTAGLSIALTLAIKNYGFQTTHKLCAIANESVDLVERIIEEEDIDADFHRCGRIKLATKRSHIKKIEQEYELTKKLGLHTSILSNEKVTEEIDYGRFYGGLLEKKSACLNPRSYIDGLSNAVRNHGGIIVENVSVEGLNRNRDASFDVYYRNGSIQAKKIIVATNGYTPDFISNVRNKLINVGSYIVVTDPLTTQELTKFKRRRLFSTYSYLLNYFRTTSDNRLLFGGRNNLRPDQDLDKSKADIQCSIQRLLPELSHKDINYVWGGRLGFTMSRIPYIGKAEENIYYSVGYCGHGVPTATWCGKAVSDYLLLGNKPIFASIPHRTAIPSKISPYFLQALSYWYRILDSLE